MAKRPLKTAVATPSIAELRASLQKKQSDLLAAKRGLAAGELANPRIITKLRKEIARELTAINRYESQRKEA